MGATITALSGVTASLSGMTLVFLGLVVNAYQSRPRDTPRAVREAWKTVARTIIVALILGGIGLVLDVVSLLVSPVPMPLYSAAIVFFFAQVVGLIVAATVTIRKLLWA